MVSNVDKLTIPLEKIFHESGSPMFRFEPFQAVPKTRKKEIPTGELLFKSGHDSEHLFSQAHDSGMSFDLDKYLFPRAAKLAQLFPYGASVNVHTGTPYEDEFIHILKELVSHKGFDPAKVLIEITEWGEVTSASDSRKLADILKMGFKLAVDDIDPQDHKNMERVHHINGAAVMHKFSHKTMQQIRAGGDDKHTALKSISDLRRSYPKSAIVMEGVSSKDRPLFPALIDAGVTVVQYYHPKSKHSGPEI